MILGVPYLCGTPFFLKRFCGGIIYIINDIINLSKDDRRIICHILNTILKKYIMKK